MSVLFIYKRVFMGYFNLEKRYFVGKNTIKG